MKPLRIHTETRVAVLYLVFSGLWIILSDRLLMLLFTNPAQLTTVQTYKGWVFVSVSAFLIYYLLRKELVLQREMRLDLEQINRTLQTSQAQYKHLFENSPAPMWIYDIETLQFLTVNDAAVRKYGYTRSEFLAMTLREIRPGAEVARFNEFTKNLNSDYQRSGPWQHRLKNGQTIYVQITSHSLVFQGRSARFVMAEDITELQAAEERLRLALSAAQQGIYDLDLQTGAAVVNDIYATMLGYDPQTFQETNAGWMERLHPDDQPAIKQIFNDYVSGKLQEYRIEFRQRTRSGDWKWLLSIGKIVEYDRTGKPLRMLGTHTDITASKQASLQIEHLLAESQRRLKRIETLHQIDTAISTNSNLNLTLDLLLERVKQELAVDAVAVLLVDPNGETFQYTAALGFPSDRWGSLPLTSANSLAGRVAQEGVLQHASGAAPARGTITAEILTTEGFQEYYGFPLNAKGRIIGVFELFHRTPLSPDAEWLSYFETLAGQAAVAIENAQLIASLQQANDDLVSAYDATIEGWSIALDLRDKETEGHTQRVCAMTVDLAQKIGVSETDTLHFRRGALLHDIGKMGIPDAILLKPGRLTEEERIIIQRHPLYAQNMLLPIRYLRPALEIPLYHHERWDGSGYPNGLKGEQIPLAARLFAIVDVYDALTTDRPYRAAWTREAALEYICQQRGKDFDPQLVDHFLAYLQEQHPLVGF